eukprot:scaffold9415_cov109-Ochromonas_danica.AAC.1
MYGSASVHPGSARHLHKGTEHPARFAAWRLQLQLVRDPDSVAPDADAVHLRPRRPIHPQHQRELRVRVPRAPQQRQDQVLHHVARSLRLRLRNDERLRVKQGAAFQYGGQPVFQVADEGRRRL